MEDQLTVKKEQAIWIANQLFNRGLVTGSTGNISFLHEDKIYISESGSCFGRLSIDSFSILTLQGEITIGKPSKEYPMHLELYRKNENCQAVIHTHSLYSTIISCLKDKKEVMSKLYAYTPYLKMLTKRKIANVPYHTPGSRELFDAFALVANSEINTYLLSNHGIVVSANTLLSAFYLSEEFEASAKIQTLLKHLDADEVNIICEN